jgi:hypothetical protein
MELDNEACPARTSEPMIAKFTVTKDRGGKSCGRAVKALRSGCFTTTSHSRIRDTTQAFRGKVDREAPPSDGAGRRTPMRAADRQRKPALALSSCSNAGGKICPAATPGSSPKNQD